MIIKKTIYIFMVFLITLYLVYNLPPVFAVLPAMAFIFFSGLILISDTQRMR